MKMRNLLFALMACVALLAFTVELSSSADQGPGMEQGLDKTKIPKKI
ncbi:hypothetical protein [Maribacter polysaccharolyticus]|nr:hypothetical protein [Maribacter polysaccharolyticus]MDE3740375.1 hypothetical protein [Maribacter polysaccharolyticus]